MQERIVEIILFLVNELKSNKQLSEVDVSLLTDSGYTPTEISTAFSWLFERLSIGQQLVSEERDTRLSHRVLHEAEKMIVTPEAYGYLLQCRQLGLLSNADIETIIEKIMAAGFSTVGVPEMKSFVAGVLLDSGNQPRMSGRISLNSTDTIH
ncbi:MAG: DUF494 domain-containing protein [Ignavibacteria bacterium]|nr:DUF494 domain-containing protein [Ignavibacteria bacterium]